MADLITCKNCGNAFSGKFCNQCGEKVYTEKDKKFSHVLEEAFHFTTHLDNKFLKTLWLYIRRPGFVSKEFCEGKRKRYYKPVSLFLIGVVLYLLFPVLQGLNLSLGNHIANNQTIHLYYSYNWAVHKMNAQHISEQQLSENFGHLSAKLSKVLLLALLPLTALALSLLFRKQKRFFFDHFILATEFNTVILFVFFLIIPVLAKLIYLISHFDISYGDTVLFISLMFVIFLGLITSSFRRFYNLSWTKAILSCFIFILLYGLVIVLYRQLVFIIVMLFL